MKTKLAILEKDKSYLTRIISVFGTCIQKVSEIDSCTNGNGALVQL